MYTQFETKMEDSKSKLLALYNLCILAPALIKAF